MVLYLVGTQGTSFGSHKRELAKRLKAIDIKVKSVGAFAKHCAIVVLSPTSNHSCVIILLFNPLYF